MYKKITSANNYTKQLIKLAIPVIMSLLLQMTYNMIDLYWVGHISSDAVAAVGSAIFFVHLGTALCSIVSIGTMIKISQAVGAKDADMQGKYAAASMISAIAIGAIYISILFLFSEQLIAFLKIDNQWVADNAVLYLRIMAIGTLVSYVNIIFTSKCTRQNKIIVQSRPRRKYHKPYPRSYIYFCVRLGDCRGSLGYNHCVGCIICILLWHNIQAKIDYFPLQRATTLYIQSTT